MHSYDKWQESDLVIMGFSRAIIPKLHQLLQNLFHLNTSLKRLDHLGEAYTTVEKEQTVTSKNHLFRVILSQQEDTRKHELVFEYVNKLTLRPEQKKFLRQLFLSGASNTLISKVLEFLMGGGKTKVILPLWAYEVADGDCLPIILVPEMSLKINLADFEATSYCSFKQRPYYLDFNADSSIDPSLLQELLENLNTVRVEKNYVVSTPSSIQSLELKFLQLLNKDEVSCQRQVDLLAQILLLLVEKGHAAIDEVHFLLQILKALIYELNGKLLLADSSVIQITIAMYLWLNEQKPRVLDLIVNPEQIKDEAHLKELMQHYIALLSAATQDAKAPYWIIDLLVDSVTAKDLCRYLSNLTELPEAVNCDPNLKKQWILLRAQFQTLLPLTLRRKLYEHYGPSPDSYCPFAVPYRANNVPTGYIFGHFMESINYTIQMVLKEGISKHDLKMLLAQWRSDALLKRQENNSEESPQEQQFSFIFAEGGFAPLLHCDLNDTTLLDKLYHYGRHNTFLVSYILEQRLLQLRLITKSLASDTINLVSQFNKVTAISATAKNHRTYHQDIHMNYATSLGIEAQVEGYLHRKKTPVISVAPSEITSFLAQQFQHHDNLLVIIDGGGFFRGIDNLSCAKLIAGLCQRYKPQIKYVLFYLQGQLCAWDIHHASHHSLASGNIEKELNCTAKQRMMFYDQENGLGRDAAHDKEAVAVLTVDAIQGKWSSMLQAAMRLRGLGEKQSLIIATNLPHLSRGHLFQRLKDNEQQKLKEEHFQAGLKKINNLFRTDLIGRLLHAESKQRKHLFRQYASMLVEEEEHDITVIYAKTSQPKKTAMVFAEFAQAKKRQWLNAVASEVTTMEVLALDVKIEKLIESIVPICSENQETQTMMAGRQIQHQRYRETQKEQQLFHQKEEKFVSLCPVNVEWIDWTWTNSWPIIRLNSLIHKQFPQRSWQFSRQLYASHNFIYTYSSQQELYTSYIKPGLALLFVLQKKRRDKGYFSHYGRGGSSYQTKSATAGAAILSNDFKRPSLLFSTSSVYLSSKGNNTRAAETSTICYR